MAYQISDLSIIVRYDDTLTAFKALSDKSRYNGRVVFIRGAKETVNGQTKYTDQGIYIHGQTPDGSESGEYLNLSNIEEISNSFRYFNKIQTDGSDVFQPALGGSTLVLKSASADLVITIDEEGVKFDVSSLKTTLVGNTANGSNTTTYPNTITGAKAYTDSLKGTTNDTSDKITIHGTRKYVDEKVEVVEQALSKKADLGSDNKILLTQLPDAILGQVMFGGTLNSGTLTSLNITPSDNFKSLYVPPQHTGSTYTIENANNSEVAKAYEGVYFIVASTANGQSILNSVVINTGDWLISTGSNWVKIDNTDAVTSVANLTGAITAEALAQKLTGISDAEKALATKAEVDKKYEKPTDGITEEDLSAEIIQALSKAEGSLQDISFSPSDGLVQITKKLSTTPGKNTSPEFSVFAKTKTLESTDTSDGLATTDDIKQYLEARFSVVVLS